MSEALRQSSVIDVAGWDYDSEFAKFPQGARAKDAVFAPALVSDPVLLPLKRYLFKRSRRAFPDHFWTEVIAYRFGCLLGLKVPPAFAAFNSSTGHSAAIIEWFYQDGKEQFRLAGEMLQGSIQPDLDRAKGIRHNLKSSMRLLAILSEKRFLESSPHQWWVDALLFDALIGNTDRHQDNWGLLVVERSYPPFRLAPLFDNGTSLGYERFPERTRSWNAADFDRYVLRGTHHIQWSLEDSTPRRGHLELLALALDEWPETKAVTSARILHLDIEDFRLAIADLTALESPHQAFVHLTTARQDFLLKLLETRLHHLKVLLS